MMENDRSLTSLFILQLGGQIREWTAQTISLSERRVGSECHAKILRQANREGICQMRVTAKPS